MHIYCFLSEIFSYSYLVAHIFIRFCLPCFAFVVPGGCTADVIFVLDSSGSIGVMNWFTVKQFVMDVVQGFKVERF